MSWFKELTSKAEAMLVNLDQNAAEAFQNPEAVIGRAFSGTDDDNDEAISQGICDDLDKLEYNETRSSSSTEINLTNSQSTRLNGLMHHEYRDDSLDNGTRVVLDSTPRPLDPQSNDIESAGVIQMGSDIQLERSSTFGTNQPSLPLNSHRAESNHNTTTDVPKASTDRNSRKFTIQKTKKNLGLFQQPNTKKPRSKNKLDQVEAKTTERVTSLPRIGAEDIRASINQSLLEYSNRAEQVRRNFVPGYETTSGPHQTHFDQTPELIIEENALSNHGNGLRNGHMQSSSSFSINFPDTSSLIGTDLSPTSIKARLMKDRRVSSRRAGSSTSLIQRVIYRLAKPYGDARVLGGQVRLSMSRVQLRLASLIAGLNYYSRSYPRIRYLVLVYLILMQMLVIYVLFFYQSNGTVTELSSQIKQQQRELSESQ